MEVSYETDRLPYRFLSISILSIGIINLLLFFTPFIAYKGAIEPYDNGFQALQYFSLVASEGAPIAFGTWVIFIGSIVTALYGGFLFYNRRKINIYTHLKIIEKSSYVYLGIFSTAMIIIFVMIDQLAFSYIGHTSEIPESSIGLQILLWLNIIAPIVMRFVVMVIYARLAESQSSS